MTTPSDALIHAARAGDADAFGQLYDAYVQRIYNFVYFKTWHRPTAEDLTSQVFLKALEKIRQFDLDKGTFQAWLYQIARNLVIDHYRTSRPTTNIDDVWDLADGTDIETDADIVLKLERVRAGLKELPAESREIVILRVWEGLSHREIADILGKREDTVKVAYSRAVGRLKAEVAVLLFVLPYFLNK